MSDKKMSTNAASKAARTMAKIKTPARARASRANGRLGGRRPAKYSVRTKSGRIVVRGETERELETSLAEWKAAADRRADLFYWRGGEIIGPVR
jgi:hypothetical protein